MHLLKFVLPGALPLCAVVFFFAYPLVRSDCNLRGLAPHLDYQCYHSKKLGVKFVYPLSVLELDTTMLGDMRLALRSMPHAGRQEVLITRRPAEIGNVRKTRDKEETELRGKGYVPNHLKPEEGEPWGNFYVITGWKPNQDVFYYKRWFVDQDIVSIEFDYSAQHKRQYDTIIPDMVKERFVIVR
jgi:hypothetical protein